MASKFDIISQALVLMGESPIAAFSEGTPGLVAEQLYTTTLDGLLTSNRWRFAIGKKALSQLVDTPLNEWTYAYQIPDDMLLLIRVYGSSRYEIYEDNLYTNANTVEIDYIYRPDETKLPAYFVECLAARLAAVMALAITNNQTMRESMQVLADKRYTEAIHKDAQGRPNIAIAHRPFIQVRQ